jgi:hypothetical protein
VTETLREKGSWLDRCWVLFVAERFGGGSGVVSEWSQAKLCDAGGNAVGAYPCRCCRPAPSEPRVPPLCRSATVGPNRDSRGVARRAEESCCFSFLRALCSSSFMVLHLWCWLVRTALCWFARTGAFSSSAGSPGVPSRRFYLGTCFWVFAHRLKFFVFP